MAGFLAGPAWVDGGDSWPSRLMDILARNRTRTVDSDVTAGWIFALPVPIIPDHATPPPPPARLFRRLPLEQARDLRLRPEEEDAGKIGQHLTQPPPPTRLWRNPARFQERALVPLLTDAASLQVWAMPIANPTQLTRQPRGLPVSEPQLPVQAGPTFLAADAPGQRQAPFRRPAPPSAGDLLSPAFVIDLPPWTAALDPPLAPQPRRVTTPPPREQTTAGELASQVAESLAAVLWSDAIQVPAHLPRPVRKLNVSEAASWQIEPRLLEVAPFGWRTDPAPKPRWPGRPLVEALSFQTDAALVRLPPWPFEQDPGPPQLPRQAWRSYHEWASPNPIAAGLIVVTGPFVVLAAAVYQAGAIEGLVFTE